MPFDVREFPAGAEMVDREPRWVAVWLFIVCVMVLVMVVLGGATRLTGSGLSIMEWAPLIGRAAAAQRRRVASGCSISTSRSRNTTCSRGLRARRVQADLLAGVDAPAVGPADGVVFLVPLAGPVGARRDRRHGCARGWCVLFLLGGAQGAVGWFMVASGFFPGLDRGVAVPAGDPSGPRAGAVCGVAVDRAVVRWPTAAGIVRPRRPRRLAWIALGLVALTIVAGGFVAGLHAGLITIRSR